MKPETTAMSEESLDPSDWASMRALGHRMVEDAFDFLESVHARPVWQPIPESVVRRFRRPAPLEPEGAEPAYQDFVEHVLPYALGNVHPRFWSWVVGTGTPMGMLAEMLAAAMNPNCAGHQQSATLVEEQVLNWFKEQLGFPADATGILVSGGSMANLVGLAVGRHVRGGREIRGRGLAAGGRRLLLYASSEVHNSSQKAVELLGLGNEALRRIPVDANYRIQIDALRSILAEDRRNGYVPFCVIGGGGTVNTGSIDDLEELADLCAEEELWFHVDGAFGALAGLSPGHRHLLAGMARADSLAFDLHKWMYMPYDVGCLLVRDSAHQEDAFSVSASYLTRFDRGISAGSTTFGNLGPELSRGFRALKVWLSIKEQGFSKYGRLIAQNIDQVAYLAGLIEKSPDLELLAPVPLNVACFRFIHPKLDAEQLNALNREILIQLHEQGIAAPSCTVLNGRFAIRVANTNHRTRREDFDALVNAVTRLGRELQGTAA